MENNYSLRVQIFTSVTFPQIPPEKNNARGLLQSSEHEPEYKTLKVERVVFDEKATLNQ